MSAAAGVVTPPRVPSPQPAPKPSVKLEKFTLASYNILANCYSNFPSSTPYVKYQWGQRQKDLVTRMLKLNADVLCLQEVDSPAWPFFQSSLSAAGYGNYEGFYQKRNSAHQDGCLIFYRRDRFKVLGTEVVDYADGTGRSALRLHLISQACNRINVFTSHLQGGPKEGYKKAGEFQMFAAAMNKCKDPTVLSGDFNALPDSDLIQNAMKGQGWYDTLRVDAVTCMNYGKPARLDYIAPRLTKDLLLSHGQVEGDLAKLQTPEEPSDHLPIVAVMAFVTKEPIGLWVFNHQLGTEETPTPAHTLFTRFNQTMNALFAANKTTQAAYDRLAVIFDRILRRTVEQTVKSPSTTGEILQANLFEEVMSHEERGILYESIALSAGLSSMGLVTYVNSMPGTDLKPSYRRALFAKFNQKFAAVFENHVGLYEIYSKVYAKVLNETDAAARAPSACFLEILSAKIASLPVGFRPFFDDLVQQEIDDNLVVACGHFDQQKMADGLKLWSFLPATVRNPVYGYVYKLEKKAGHKVEHPDFGNAGFHQKLGPSQSVHDHVRRDAIGYLLLERVVALLQKNQTEHALALFNKVPQNLRNEIFGATYHHEKDVYKAAVKADINHPTFGEVAFCNTHRFAGYAMSDAARIQVVQSCLHKLG